MTASTRDLKAGLKVAGSVAYTGDISPAQLTANTDDWAPTGLATAAIVRVSTDASRNLTGITGGADGRLIVLMNVGSFDLVLRHDVTSTAGNRFYCPDNTDFTLKRNMTAILNYDSTSSRWRVTGGGAASAGLDPLGANVVGTGGGFGERWHMCGVTSHDGAGFGNSTYATGTFFATPFISPRGGTIDRIGFCVSAGVGSSLARVGLYQATSATDPYPNALVVDGGQQDCSTGTTKSSTISVVLSPTTLYWAVLLSGTAAPNLVNIFSTSWATMGTPMGIAPALNLSAPIRFERTQTYGALPSTFPAGPPTAYSLNPFPIIAVRYSA
jgi:hypothetical protein